MFVKMLMEDDNDFAHSRYYFVNEDGDETNYFDIHLLSKITQQAGQINYFEQKIDIQLFCV